VFSLLKAFFLSNVCAIGHNLGTFWAHFKTGVPLQQTPRRSAVGLVAGINLGSRASVGSPGGDPRPRHLVTNRTRVSARPRLVYSQLITSGPHFSSCFGTLAAPGMRLRKSRRCLDSGSKYRDVCRRMCCTVAS